jgi:HK97 family phage prohead protease
MSIAAHEAKHAAAAMVLDVDVFEARVDAPSPGVGGHVVHARAERRHDALISLAGRMGDAGWPPKWPPRTDRSGDEYNLAEYVQAVGLDEAGWDRLCSDAKRLVRTPEFKGKAGVIEALLDHGCVLDRDKLDQINAATAVRPPPLEHKRVEASARPTTELGEFSAIAAAYSVDRQGDEIVPGAFAKTIEAWRESGKRIPLHWNHSGRAEDIIGSVDPASMREIREGLYVRGKLELDTSTVAREAWRSMKANALSLSFGYTAPGSRLRKDGVRELTEIDLFEISVVPSPANPDTRFLELKSVDPPDRGRPRPAPDSTAAVMADIRKRAAEVGIHLPVSRAERMAEIEASPPARPFSLLPDGWDTWRPRRRIRDVDPDELALRDLRRQTDRMRLHAALGWDQDLIEKVGA